MTLDNDRNPIAPHRPSDPPPRRPAGQGEGFAQTEAGGVAAPVRSPADAPSQDTDASDATSSRAVVRSILAALPLDVRAAVVAAVLAWCRSLAAVAGMVGRRELGAVEALPLADAATVTLMERDGRPPHDVVGAMLGAWWASGPYDLARQVSRGTTSAADFEDALGFLVQLQGDADALAYVTSAAPRIVRCPLPAGVDRVTMRGDTFLPAELSRAALDALTRDARRVGRAPRAGERRPRRRPRRARRGRARRARVHGGRARRRPRRPHCRCRRARSSERRRARVRRPGGHRRRPRRPRGARLRGIGRGVQGSRRARGAARGHDAVALRRGVAPPSR